MKKNTFRKIQFNVNKSGHKITRYWEKGFGWSEWVRCEERLAYLQEQVAALKKVTK